MRVMCPECKRQSIQVDDPHQSITCPLCGYVFTADEIISKQKHRANNRIVAGILFPPIALIS